VTLETSLADVGRTLVAGHLSGVPVVDEHRQVVGFVSESDLLGALLRGTVENAEDATAGDLMSHPPIVADEFMTTDEVLSLLREKHIHHLPVVRQGRLVGIITPHDVLKYHVEHILPIPPEEA
jgi:CBS domain-containing protein